MVSEIRKMTPEGVFDISGMSVRGSTAAKSTGISVAYIMVAGSNKTRTLTRAKDMVRKVFGAESLPMAHGAVSERWDAVVLKNNNVEEDTGVVFGLSTYSNSARHLYAGINEIRNASPVVEFKPLSLAEPKSQHIYVPSQNITNVLAHYSSARGASVVAEEISAKEVDTSIGYVVQWPKRVYHRAVCNKVNLSNVGLWAQAHGKNSFIVQGWATLLGLSGCDYCNPGMLRSEFLVT